MFEWLKKLFKKREKAEAPDITEDKPLTVGEALFPELSEDDQDTDDSTEILVETEAFVTQAFVEDVETGNADHLEGPLETGEEPAPEPTPTPVEEPVECEGVVTLEDVKNNRIHQMACDYLNTNGATLQTIAKQYGVSSTTVSKYFSKLLPGIDPDLATKVKEKLEKVKAENAERFKANAKNAKK